MNLSVTDNCLHGTGRVAQLLDTVLEAVHETQLSSAAALCSSHCLLQGRQGDRDSTAHAGRQSGSGDVPGHACTEQMNISHISPYLRY